DMQYLTDNAPLLPSIPDTYSQFLLGRFSLYHAVCFSAAFSQFLVLEDMLFKGSYKCYTFQDGRMMSIYRIVLCRSYSLSCLMSFNTLDKRLAVGDNRCILFQFPIEWKDLLWKPMDHMNILVDS